MAQLVARLVRNEKVGGSNPPSSTTGRHPIADVGFLYAWARWCGACRCVACGAAGVRGACWAGLWGRAAVCAGGRRPAREPSAPRASLGASPRSPARPRRRPQAPQPGPQGSLYPSVSATPGKQINMILCLDARQLSTLPSSIGTRHIG